MYSGHKVGLILSGDINHSELPRQFESIPHYIDIIYIFNNSTTDTSVIKTPPTQQFCLLKGDAGHPENNTLMACKKAVEDNLDIVIIKDSITDKDTKYFSLLLDPIVWGKADLTKEKLNHTPHQAEESDQCSYANSVMIYQLKFAFQLSHFLDQKDNCAALSRLALHTLAQEFNKKTSLKILAAIPCYNEEIAIGSIVLKTQKYVDEVLVVDDGSTDGTALIAEIAGAKLVKHSKNEGYGAAIRTCFTYARTHNFDAMVTLDGDGQHDPVYIPQFIEQMRKDSSDIIIGSRFLGNEQNIPYYRRGAMNILTKITNVIGDIDTTDSQSGYRIYSRRAIERFNFTENGMGAGSEILTYAKEHDMKLSEVSIVTRYDIANSSSHHPIIHGIDVLSSLFKRLVQKKPFIYSSIPGSIFTILGIIFGIFVLEEFFLTGHFSMTYILLTSIFLLVGLFVPTLGVIISVLTRKKSLEKKN